MQRWLKKSNASFGALDERQTSRVENLVGQQE